MKTTTFLSDVVADAMSLFEYYRNGPVAMHKLQPGFIFQQCVDQVLNLRKIESVECGLGDHCLTEMGLAMQLKTTVQESPGDQFVFCRSSVRSSNPLAQKQLRIKDVESRIYDMFGSTGTFQFVLVHVNLTTRDHASFLLHDGDGVVGDWLNIENISSPQKQTHFVIRKSKLVKLV